MPKNTKICIWQPRWNMISPVILPGPWLFLLGPCPRGPHPADGAAHRAVRLVNSVTLENIRNQSELLHLLDCYTRGRPRGSPAHHAGLSCRPRRHAGAAIRRVPRLTVDSGRDFPSDKFHEIRTQRRSVSRWKLSEQNFENFTIRGRFSKKTQNILTKFKHLATSANHNYAMITDHRKFTIKWYRYGMSSFRFTVRINLKSFPWAVGSVQKLFQNFQHRPMSDIG